MVEELGKIGDLPAALYGQVEAAARRAFSDAQDAAQDEATKAAVESERAALAAGKG